MIAWRLVLEYEEEDLEDPGAPPRVFEWDAIDRMAFTRSGTWNGNAYEGYFEDDRVMNQTSLTVAGDRSRVTSFFGRHAENEKDWTISGSNVPVVLDLSLMSTFKAYVSGLATCDAVEQVTELSSTDGSGRFLTSLTGFHCSSESYLEIYCD